MAMVKKKTLAIIAALLIFIVLIFSFTLSEFVFKNSSASTEPFSGALWQRPLENFATSVIVDQKKVFTTDNAGMVYCFNSQNGESVWNSSVDGGTRNPRPITSDGRIYFGYQERKLCCMDENTGTILWTFQNQHAVEEPSKAVSARAIIKDDQLFAVSGSISAHNPITGELLWQAFP